MTFIAPDRLLLLVLPLLIAAAYVVALRRRTRYAVRFTNLDLLDKVAPERPGWRRHLPAVILGVALISMVVALARPATAVQVARKEATMVLVVDVSLSMAADDVAPTRIDAAKAAASDFVRLAPEDLSIGIVAFSGNAAEVLPPTTDRAATQRAIDGLELGDGTAIGEGIFTGLRLAETSRTLLADGDDVGGRGIALVVLSDGETTAGRSEVDAARAAVAAGVPIDTISFGTADGEIDYEGDLVPVPVNEGVLREVASTTGGGFFEAASTDELNGILDGVGATVSFEEQQREISELFTGAGFVLALLATAGSLLWFSRMP